MLPQGYDLLQEIWRAQGAKAYGLCAPAMHLAETAHEGQRRRSGEPYTTHLVAVAGTLWERYADPVLTAAGLLHDSVEDCADVSMERIYADFGDEVGFLVDAVTKDHLGFHGRSEVFTDKIERLLWAGMQDVRVLMLKLADREHNLATLDVLKPAQKVRISFETQAVFHPLADILGWDKGSDIDVKAVTEALAAFLAAEGITTARQLHQALLRRHFASLDTTLYKKLYGNTREVAWEVRQPKEFATLLQLPDIAGRIRLLRMEANTQGYFTAVFTLQSDLPLPRNGTKLGVAAYATAFR